MTQRTPVSAMAQTTSGVRPHTHPELHNRPARRSSAGGTEDVGGDGKRSCWVVPLIEEVVRLHGYMEQKYGLLDSGACW